MGQNCKVVHQPEKTLEKAELNRLSHLSSAPAIQSIGSNIMFLSVVIGFEPCPDSYATLLIGDVVY